MQVKEKLLDVFKTGLYTGTSGAPKSILLQVMGRVKDIEKKCSKYLDENDEPRVVYHITDGSFSEFDLSKARQDMDNPAFFFSDGEQDGAGMGGRVMARFLNIRNPKEGRPIVHGSGPEVREQLIKEGYDAKKADGTFLSVCKQAEKVLYLCGNPVFVLVYSFYHRHVVTGVSTLCKTGLPFSVSYRGLPFYPQI